MFNDKTDDSQRSKDNQSRDKAPMNKRRVPRDTALLQLPNSVTKRLNVLKNSDSFRHTQNEDSGASSMRGTVELEKSHHLIGNRSKGMLIDLDKENIPE